MTGGAFGRIGAGAPVQVDENETISHTLSKPSSGAALDTHNKATPAIIGNDDGKKAGRTAGPFKQLSKYHTSKLTFKVSPNLKQIKGFATSVVPIVCGGGFSGPVTKLVSIGASSATITNSGEFQGKLVLHGTNGEESTTTLVGKFTSAKTASGKVTYKVGKCNVTEPFTARKK
jgi:hypothetical protein